MDVTVQRASHSTIPTMNPNLYVCLGMLLWDRSWFATVSPLPQPPSPWKIDAAEYVKDILILHVVAVIFSTLSIRDVIACSPLSRDGQATKAEFATMDMNRVIVLRRPDLVMHQSLRNRLDTLKRIRSTQRQFRLWFPSI